MIGGEQTRTASGELLLAVTGDAPRSRRARVNLERALEALGADLSPREIDLLVEPEQSLAYGILATPALLHIKADGSNGVLYGDLSDEVRLMHFLEGLLGGD